MLQKGIVYFAFLEFMWIYIQLKFVIKFVILQDKYGKSLSSIYYFDWRLICLRHDLVCFIMIKLYFYWHLMSFLFILYYYDWNNSANY